MSESDQGGAPTQAASDDPRPAPGRRFARRYLVERLLGRGGMGSVWAVHDVDLGERVALKTLDRAEGSAQAIERFRREVRLARRVTHRNVARIFDIGESAGIHYLTMELVDGESLTERLQRAPMSAALACDVAGQIAAGLAVAHAAQIIHRDLKPGNVLLERGGRAVVTDFGIACALTGDVQLTLEGTGLMGTPAYMSPEQVRGDPVDARSDIYALGVMLYEMLSGRLPFAGDSTIAMALARLSQVPDDPRTFAPVGDALAALVLDCLAVDPARRPQHAGELGARLAALEPLPGAAAPTDAPGTSTRAPVPVSPTGGRHATTQPGQQAVAVLPFRYRGVAGEEYLADALTDEIIDLLSRNRGLRVSARGATAAFGPDADPRAVGTELGVDVVVEGTVQRSAEALRIQARLVAVDTGFQLWSDRFDGRLVDVFELQDRLATHIAETLRVQLQTASQRNEVPAEAIAVYLRARAQLRAYHMGGAGPDGALALLERAVALAPAFRPAIAALALVTERAWFSPTPRDGVSWRERTEAAVARALAEAPDIPESHVAAARTAMQLADYATAARSVTRALAIAPTFASAHEVLGCLQCEAARADEGLRHLRLAVTLDPTLTNARTYQARYHELHGQPELADRLLEETERLSGPFELALLLTRARLAAWRGDFAAVERQRAKLSPATSGAPLFDLLLRSYTGDIHPGEALTQIRALAHVDFGPRFTAFGLQLLVEAVSAAADDDDLAERLLAEAVDGPMVDLDWLDHCPVLGRLRARAGFAKLRDRVRERAEQVWMIE